MEWIRFVILALLSFTFANHINALEEDFRANGILIEHRYVDTYFENRGPATSFYFSEINYRHQPTTNAHTRIIRESDGKVIFDGDTSVFNGFFVLNNGTVIAYNSRESRWEPNLYVFDPNGNIEFYGYSELYREQFQIQSQPIKEKANGQTALFENQELPQSNFEYSYSEASVDPEDHPPKIIISACGPVYPIWISEIMAVDTDAKGKVEGFSYLFEGAFYYFDLTLHQSLLEEEKQQLVKAYDFDEALSCGGPQQDWFDGFNYSTWCVNDDNTRDGAFQRWIKADNGELADLKNSGANEGSHFEIVNDFYLSIEGQYQQNERVGIWSEAYLDGRETCEFKNNQLNGLCESFETGQKTASIEFVDNLANGLEKEFENGVLSATQTWRNGFIEDIATEYHPNGEVSAFINYSHSKMHGRALYFEDDGRLIKCEDYIDDELVYASASCGGL